MDTILQPAIAAGSAVDLKQLTDLEAAAAVLKTALADKKQQGNAVTLLEKSSSDENSVKFSLLVLQLVEALLPLTAEAKTGKQTLAVLQAGVAAAPSLSAGYLPLILSAIEKPPQNKWKVKVAALEVMAGGTFRAFWVSFAKQALDFIPNSKTYTFTCTS